MHILIGLGLAVALLYFWLVGHWFARVLVHLILMPLLAGLLAALFTVGVGQPGDPIGVIGGCIIGLTAGWFISSAPVYWHRHRLRKLAHELTQMSLEELDQHLHLPIARQLREARIRRLLSQEPVGAPFPASTPVPSDASWLNAVFLLIMAGFIATGIATAVWW